MEARISAFTLGVVDLEKSVAFYRDGLGLPTSFKPGDGVAFFMNAGTRLSLYPDALLAQDIGRDIAPRTPAQFSGTTLAYTARTKEEVPKVLAQAARAGARIVKPAQDTFWGGHHGYFADPDGYYWEVSWGPMFDFAPDGALLFKSASS